MTWVGGRPPLGRCRDGISFACCLLFDGSTARKMPYTMQDCANLHGSPLTTTSCRNTAKVERPLSTAAKHIELVVGAQAGEVGQTVRHTKKRRDCGYVPNLVIAETVLAQRDAVSLIHRMSLLRNLHSKVEHGSLSWRDVRLAVVARHLIRDQRIFGADT